VQVIRVPGAFEIPVCGRGLAGGDVNAFFFQRGNPQPRFHAILCLGVSCAVKRPMLAHRRSGLVVPSCKSNAYGVPVIPSVALETKRRRGRLLWETNRGPEAPKLVGNGKGNGRTSRLTPESRRLNSALDLPAIKHTIWLPVEWALAIQTHHIAGF